MRRLLTVSAVFALLLPLNAIAQIYPPKPGVKIPQAYYDRVSQDKTAFRFQNAWLKKVERVREARDAYIKERGFYHRGFLAPSVEPLYAVTGTVQVPVFMVKYSNTGADPYPTSTLDTKLFTGPFAPQTLTQYYNEISYGNLNMTGTVYGWHTLPNTDTYYEGGAGCNGLCGTSQVGALITNTLNAYDGAVDFGQYDNDGPDGVPNSGDDDGYADFVAFVHPEFGGECGGSNVWSHRWVLSGWTGSAYTTNDPRTGGGFIRVNDYVIQPALNCGGVTVIDIGVFCHEFGHALGLPDLYDTNGGSEGIGEWGLMGSGSWNTVTQPAHMSAWCKKELGWANVIKASEKKQTYNVPNAEFNTTVYQLDVAEERWRRMTTCAIGGATSMRCGLTAAESASRNWVSGDGYGDGWSERISRTFSYNGGLTPITFQYDYSYDSEPAYDYTYVEIDVNGTVSTLATYDNVGSGTANINILPYLSGSGASTYTLSFRFTSDVAWSDRDGSYNSSCGPFVFDNVSVNGGGETYSTDFETSEDGWCVDMTDPAEHFLVENRQAVGSDIAIHGGGGLAIWHINRDIAHAIGVNSGGASGLLVHGVALEEADNLNDLANGVNRGDGGDPYPGSTNNFTFDNLSSPNSRGESGNANQVCVINISPNPGGGGSMSADMRGGYPLPTFASIVPPNAPNVTSITVQISGTGFVCDPTVELSGPQTISASSVYWRDKSSLTVTFPITGALDGMYDLTITNPGGGCVVVNNAFIVEAPVPTALRSLSASQVGETVEILWEAIDEADILGWRVYRDAAGTGAYMEISGGVLPPRTRRFVDENIVKGGESTYRLSWITPGGEQLAGETSVTTRALQFELAQNHPNPFNPRTTIPNELASAARTTLKIFDARGALIRTLVDGKLDANRYAIEWDGTDNLGREVPSGMYFYKLVAGSYQDVRKLMLMK